MSVTVIVELHLQPGLADAYVARLQEAFAETRKFAGFEDVRAFRCADDADAVFLIEQWASRTAYEAYLDWRNGGGMQERLARMLTRPLSVTYLDAVG